MNKIITLLFQSLTVLLLMVGTTVNAQDTKSYQFEYDGAVYTLYYYEKDNVIVPEKAVLNRYIKEAFQEKRAFSVPTAIREEKTDNDVMQTLEFPVKEISPSAFEECQNLTALTVPGGINTIGNRAFFRCSSLSKVTIGEGIKVLGSQYDDYIEGGVFGDCTALTSVELPSTLIAMPGAFSGCTALSSIVLPASVENLDGAFAYCTSLTSIKIPKSVKLLNATFSYCKSLESVVIDDAAIVESERAFENCKKLKSVNLGNAITLIGNGMFKDCSSIESIILPTSVNTIDKFAFSQCTTLQSITMPAVESIGSNAFQLSGLTEVHFPNTLKKIGGAAFNGTNITTIELPQSLETIETSVFSSCANLTTVILPASIKSIEKYAFQKCTSLSKCYSYIEEPFNTGEDAFYSGYNKPLYETLYVPKGTLDKYKGMSGWRFRYIVEMENESGISSSTQTANINSLYSLGGVKQSKAHQGLNISRGKKWIKK